MDKKLVKRSGKMLIGIGAGTVLFTICPPAALAVGLFAFARGARSFAQTGSPDAARQMFMGYGGISSGTSDVDQSEWSRSR